MKRKDRERDSEFAKNVIAACEYATFSTTTPDGSPYSVAISPVLINDVIYFHCALHGQKLDNIQNNPNVCISAVTGTKVDSGMFTMRYQSAVITGTASMTRDVAEKTLALQKICKKYCPNNPHVMEKITQDLSRTGICKITISSITGKENPM